MNGRNESLQLGPELAAATSSEPERRMYNRNLFLRAALPAVAMLLLMTGCHPAMSTQSDNSSQRPADSSMFPLRFPDHGFPVHCYTTDRKSVLLGTSLS